MHYLKSAFLFFIGSIFIITGCSPSADNWTELVPGDVTMVIVPASNVQSNSLLNKEYVSILDDITPSAIQQVTAVSDSIPAVLELNSISLMPVTSTTSDLLWIYKISGASISDWSDLFLKPFTQTNYSYKGNTIYKLFLNNSITFATQVGDWLILSESSFATEQSLRTVSGDHPALLFEDDPLPGSIIVNTPEMDTWVEQLAEVLYRPSVKNSFKGTEPAIFRNNVPLDTLGRIQLDGNIPVDPDSSSELVKTFSSTNAEIELDRYIAGNAAAFAILRQKPYLAPPSEVTNASSLDSLLINDTDLYRELAASLGEKFAVESFPESGLSSSGEYLYMRKIADMGKFRDLINRLTREGVISIYNSSYQISSTVLARMIGSELCDFRDFYLDVSNNVVVIAKRSGLAESVTADRNRRRVIYYDETYSAARDQLPDSVSGFVWIQSADFLKFLRPYLKTGTVAGGILNRFNILSITMQTENNEVSTRIRSFKKEGSSLPYQELWVLPLSNSELTGTPVLSNIAGSISEEIIFATTEGRVIALASDGTIALQTRTGTDVPLGSPVIYDWYGNGQPVIMIAAGNKIYAWNNNGALLPNFPITMPAAITAPLVVTDVLRNGVPEILVAVENRTLNLLNARGDNVSGWPQAVNALITDQPRVSMVDGTWSVWAASENTMHGWLRNGAVRPGYPKFINARFTGSPLVMSNQVLGTAADGYLYSIGTVHTLSDSLSMQMNSDSVSVRALYISNNELMGAGLQESVLLKDSTQFYREDLISTQSLNGSVFLYNKKGELRFTQSLGQPASDTYLPGITDINSDQVRELMALGDYGRLFAWEVLTNERIYDIPTSGMKYPLLTDLNGDGLKELIAQTREGLRCWTISKAEE